MMIQANEIRIGNKVKPVIDGCILTVIGIDCNGIHYDCEHHASELAEWHTIEPILLTAEVLLKCGFNDDRGEYYELGVVTVKDEKYELGELGEGFSYGLSEWDEDEKVVIKTLHQLQNLYFALTNTELKIDL